MVSEDDGEGLLIPVEEPPASWGYMNAWAQDLYTLVYCIGMLPPERGDELKALGLALANHCTHKTPAKKTEPTPLRKAKG